MEVRNEGFEGGQKLGFSGKGEMRVLREGRNEDFERREVKNEGHSV